MTARIDDRADITLSQIKMQIWDKPPIVGYIKTK